MHENKSHILGRKGGVVLLVFVGWVQYAAIQSPWGQNPGPKFLFNGRTMISWYLIRRRKFCLISCQAVLKGSMCQIKENAVHSMISLTLVGMRQGTFHPCPF